MTRDHLRSPSSSSSSSFSSSSSAAAAALDSTPASPASSAPPSSSPANGPTDGSTAPRCAPPRSVKVAVIGSGLAGLTAAHLLASPLEAFQGEGRREEGGRRRTTLGGTRPSKAAPAPVSVEVHLFERAASLGMDSNSITVVPSKGEAPFRIDVPMRAFAGGYYPELLQLYAYLDVPYRKSDFTYSFAHCSGLSLSSTVGPHSASPSEREGDGDGDGDSDSDGDESIVPFIIYNGRSGLSGFSLPSHLSPSASRLVGSPRALLAYLIALASHASLLLLLALAYIRLVVLALWHHFSGHTRDPDHQLSRKTLVEWCEEQRLGDWTPRNRTVRSSGGGAKDGTQNVFVDGIIVPLFSAVMTARWEVVKQTPVAEVLDYVALTFLRNHFTVRSGIRTVVSRLSARLPPQQIHLSTAVKSIAPSTTSPGTVRLEVESTVPARTKDEGGADERDSHTWDGFHHVVFATQANQTAEFLSSYLTNLTTDGRQHRQEEKKALSATMEKLRSFRYERSVVVNHTIGSHPGRTYILYDSDANVLPRSPSDRRDLNLVTPVASQCTRERTCPSSDEGLKATMPSDYQITQATHILRPFHALDSDSCSGHKDPNRPLLMQTTNPLPAFAPRPSAILSISHFERVVLTLEGKLAQRSFFVYERRKTTTRPSFLLDRGPGAWEMKLGPMQGKGGVRPSPAAAVAKETREGQRGDVVTASPGLWFAGSWSPGIPLLEGCVTSARLVTTELLRREDAQFEGGVVPWEKR